MREQFKRIAVVVWDSRDTMILLLAYILFFTFLGFVFMGHISDGKICFSLPVFLPFGN